MPKGLRQQVWLVSPDPDAIDDLEPIAAHQVPARRKPARFAGFAVAVMTLAFWIGLPLLAAFGPSPASVWQQIDPRLRAAAVFGLIFGLVYGVLRAASAAANLGEHRDQ